MLTFIFALYNPFVSKVCVTVTSGLEEKSTLQVCMVKFLVVLYVSFLRFITVRPKQSASTVRKRMFKMM